MPKKKTPHVEYDEVDEFEDEYDDEDEEEFNATVDDFVSGVVEHPRVRRVFTSLTSTLDRVGQVLDHVSRVVSGAGRAAGPTPQGDAPPSSGPRAAPRPRPQPLNPYVVLGFNPNIPLTVEMVKERRKQLALLFHGDRGGFEESMKRVNAAADMLLAKIEGK